MVELLQQRLAFRLNGSLLPPGFELTYRLCGVHLCSLAIVAPTIQLWLAKEIFFVFPALSRYNLIDRCVGLRCVNPTYDLPEIEESCHYVSKQEKTWT